MADSDSRTLQRRAATSDDPADRARVLVERVRRGELERDRVELAAYVGDPAARLAIHEKIACGRCLGMHVLMNHALKTEQPLQEDMVDGKGRPIDWDTCPNDCPECGGTMWVEPPPPPEKIGAWAKGIGRWGIRACVRAGVAAGRVAWEETLSDYETVAGPEVILDRAPEIALDAAQAWVDDPTEENVERCNQATHADRLTGGRTIEGIPWPATGMPWWAYPAAVIVLASGSTALMQVRVHPGSMAIPLMAEVIGEGGEAAVRAAIREELGAANL